VLLLGWSSECLKLRLTRGVVTKKKVRYANQFQ